MDDYEELLTVLKKVLPEDYVTFFDGYKQFTKIIIIKYHNKHLEIGFNGYTGKFSWLDIVEDY